MATILTNTDFVSESEFIKVLESAVEELRNRRDSGEPVTEDEYVIIRLENVKDLGKEMTADQGKLFLKLYEILVDEGERYGLFCQVESERDED